MTVFRHLLASCSISFIAVNLVVWCVPLVFLSLLIVILPGRRGDLRVRMNWIYRAAVRADDWWFRTVLGYELRLSEAELSAEETCIIVSNHRSWTDIFLIQSAIASTGPIVKFLVKRELVWIPLLGIIFWAFDFPLLKRNATGEGEAERKEADRRRVVDACEVIRESPSAILSFVEGTRFSAAKREAMGSPFTYLLRPRPGGFAGLIEGLRDCAPVVLDVTLVYPDKRGFWRFLGGCLAEPEIEIRRHSIAEIQDARSWLTERWTEKDELIASRLEMYRIQT